MHSKWYSPTDPGFYATTRDVTVPAGQYWVSVLTPVGYHPLNGYCWVNSSVRDVSVTGPGTITPGGDLNICNEGYVYLTAGEGSSYSWSPGGQS